MAPGRRNHAARTRAARVAGERGYARAELGYALLEVLAGVLLAAMLAGVSIALFAARVNDAHAAALAFEALLASAEARAAGNAVSAAGSAANAPGDAANATDGPPRSGSPPGSGSAPASGITVTVTPGTGGSEARVYLGRPIAGSAVPLQRDPGLAPVFFGAAISIAGSAPGAAPFSVFFSTGGHMSVQPNFDAGSATQTIAVEPPCPSSLAFAFANEIHREVHAFACEDGQLLY